MVPCVLIGKVTSGVPLNVPTQLEAVGAVGLETEHSPLMSAKVTKSGVGATGTQSESLVITISAKPFVV